MTDFAPLRVDYMERFSAAGMTSGGYNKRDGRCRFGFDIYIYINVYLYSSALWLVLWQDL